MRHILFSSFVATALAGCTPPGYWTTAPNESVSTPVLQIKYHYEGMLENCRVYTIATEDNPTAVICPNSDTQTHADSEEDTGSMYLRAHRPVSVYVEHQ